MINNKERLQELGLMKPKDGAIKPFGAISHTPPSFAQKSTSQVQTEDTESEEVITAQWVQVPTESHPHALTSTQQPQPGYSPQQSRHIHYHQHTYNPQPLDSGNQNKDSRRVKKPTSLGDYLAHVDGATLLVHVMMYLGFTCILTLLLALMLGASADGREERIRRAVEHHGAVAEEVSPHA